MGFFFGPLVSGGLGLPFRFRSLAYLCLTTPSLAADSRCARIWLLRTASLLLEVGLRITKPFPFSPFTFVPDDEWKYI